MSAPTHKDKPGGFDHARRHEIAAELAVALCEMPAGTLWCVGSMEDGPFARLCWPMPDGGYTGGYVEAEANTPAAALYAALDKGKTKARGESGQ
jgi:hypothetical protein